MFLVHPLPSTWSPAFLRGVCSALGLPSTLTCKAVVKKIIELFFVVTVENINPHLQN